jgi:uncharacterized protein
MELRKKSTLLFLFFAAALMPLCAAEIPPLTAPVMDTAGIIQDETRNGLNRYLNAVNDQTGIQIAVLTVSTLDGEPVESYSMRAAEAWRLGQKGKDNGVLLVVAPAEHKVRIETGYGLEGTLTDTKSGLIIRNSMTPYFKNGDYSAGISAGIQQIVQVTTGNAVIPGAEAPQHDAAGQNSDSAVLAALIFFLVFFGIIMGAGKGGFLGPLLWLGLFSGMTSGRNGHSSDFHRGSGSSGGSFRGGGGGFGGGGASGSW